MFLKITKTGDLIEVLDIKELIDPFIPAIQGRTQAGEDTMDTDDFKKTDLIFPSGESLPLCWRDSQYRVHAAA
jgi:hypothetical protein